MKTKTNQEQKENNRNEEQANNEVVKLDFGQLKEGLSGFVRGTVEEALNGLLEAEAQHLCGAKRHERSEGRKAYGIQSSQHSVISTQTMNTSW